MNDSNFSDFDWVNLPKSAGEFRLPPLPQSKPRPSYANQPLRQPLRQPIRQPIRQPLASIRQPLASIRQPLENTSRYRRIETEEDDDEDTVTVSPEHLLELMIDLPREEIENFVLKYPQILESEKIREFLNI